MIILILRRVRDTTRSASARRREGCGLDALPEQRHS